MTFDQADAILRRLPPVTGEEWVPLDRLAGRIAKEAVHAPQALPVAPRAAMDGYALRYADLDETAWGQQAFPVVFELHAGEQPAQALPRQACAAIATGAWLPGGADVVVPFEWTIKVGEAIRLKRRPTFQENVVVPGEEMSRGVCLVSPGERLHARHVLGLAAHGIGGLVVRKPLRVATVQTGDELVEPGQEAGPYGIFNSTGYALMNELAALGATWRHFGHAPDRLHALRHALETALAWEPDVVLTTGGVSVGSRDLVPAVWEEMGAQRLIWRVAMKPGKAFYAATLERTWIFGLSGNPVAALATYYALVRPALASLVGMAVGDHDWGTLANDYAKPVDRTRLLWGVRDPEGRGFVHVAGAPTLEGVMRAEALLILAPRREPYRRGDRVRAIPLGPTIPGNGVYADMDSHTFATAPTR